MGRFTSTLNLVLAQEKCLQNYQNLVMLEAFTADSTSEKMMVYSQKGHLLPRALYLLCVKSFSCRLQGAYQHLKVVALSTNASCTMINRRATQLRGN